MYKVFFNNKVLYFSDKQISADTIGKYYNYSSIKNVKVFIHELFNNWERAESIEIGCEDLESCWSDFCNYFKLIDASGGIVQNQNGKYLFIKRLGKWDLPKGKCEKRESAEECAEREIEEECGISNLVLKKKITNTFHTYILKEKPVLKKTSWYLYYYNKSEKLIPQTEENITEVKWFSKNEIKIIIANTYLSIIDVIKESGIV